MIGYIEYALEICRTCVKARHCKSLLKREHKEASRNVTIRAHNCRLIPVDSISESISLLTIIKSQHLFTRVRILTRTDEAAVHMMEFIAFLDRNAKECVERLLANNTKAFLAVNNE